MSDTNILPDLNQFDLFRNIEPNQLAQISDSLHRREIPTGKTILSLGHKSEIVYFLLNGAVKVTLKRKSGGSIILSLCGPGAVLGELSALSSSGHAANVTTLDTCDMLWMNAAAFSKFVRTVPELGFNLSGLLAQRLRHSTLNTNLMAEMKVAGRLAWLLNEFSRQFEEFGVQNAAGKATIPMRLPQGDLAATIGATRESVNKILMGFKQDGLLTIDDGQRITLLNRSGLEEVYHK